MKLHWFSVFVLCSSLRGILCALVSGPEDIYVFHGESGTLTCQVEADNIVIWSDLESGDTIFAGEVGSNDIKRGDSAGVGTKYENFDYFSPSGSVQFDLVINDAVFNADEGVYRCQETLSTSRNGEVFIEVKPQQKSISCQSSVECPSKDSSIPSEVTCVCTANGAFPESLQFQWINATGSNTERTESSSGLSGTFDFTSSATAVIDKDNPMVSCNLTGYNSEVNENEMISTYQFSPPSCMLDIDCSEAVITCNCVDASPEDIKYTFYDKDQNILDGDQPTSNQMRVDIGHGEDNTFYCWGCNGIYFGEHSFVNNTVPCPSTTILPTTSEPTSDTTSLDITTNSTANNVEPTPSATTPNKTGDADPGTTGSPNGLVIGLSVVGSLIAVAVIVIIILFVLKRWKNPTERKNAVTATTGDTSSAPVYGVIDKSKKKKSDKTDGNGMQMSDAPEYAAVSKPLNSEPKPAPRSSQPPPTNSTEKQELQYADIDHSNRTPSNQIRQPAEAPTEYATVQSVIV